MQGRWSGPDLREKSDRFMALGSVEVVWFGIMRSVASKAGLEPYG